MSFKQKLAELNLTLPILPKPVAAYVPAVRTGSLIFVSGQLPFVEGQLACKGQVGGDATLENAKAAARVAALNCLAVLDSLVDLDQVKQIVKVTGYVSSAPNFYDHPQVINGASEFLIEVFGDAGRHARAAFGVAALPMNASVEVELVAEV